MIQQSVFLLLLLGFVEAQFGTLADFSLVDGGLYKGGLRRGRPHGRGTLQYFTDDKKGRYNYTGDFVDGRRMGNGATAFRDGSVFSGHYENDVEEGRGQIKYANGNLFEGFFKAGRREGSGKLSFAFGGRREGQWLRDKLNGFAFYHHNGGVSIERWSNGRRIGDDAFEWENHRQQDDAEAKEQENNVIQGEYLSPSSFSRGGASLNMSFSADSELGDISDSSELRESSQQSQQSRLQRVFQWVFGSN